MMYSRYTQKIAFFLLLIIFGACGAPETQFDFSEQLPDEYYVTRISNHLSSCIPSQYDLKVITKSAEMDELAVLGKPLFQLNITPNKFAKNAETPIYIFAYPSSKEVLVAANDAYKRSKWVISNFDNAPVFVTNLYSNMVLYQKDSKIKASYHSEQITKCFHAIIGYD